MDLIVHSLYNHKEVFLRKLVRSNFSPFYFSLKRIASDNFFTSRKCCCSLPERFLKDKGAIFSYCVAFSSSLRFILCLELLEMAQIGYAIGKNTPCARKRAISILTCVFTLQ